MTIVMVDAAAQELEFKTLVVVSVAAASLLPKFQAMVLVFSVAITKAQMVARNYMHLKREKALFYALAPVPLALIIIFLFGRFPDVVYRVTKH